MTDGGAAARSFPSPAAVSHEKSRAPFPGPGLSRSRSERYFACALSAAMSASLRSVITPILLSR